MRTYSWLWQLVGFATTTLFGTLLHFLFDITGGALWAAPFSGVNESTFEHMKLIFWPMALFALIQGFFFKGSASFSGVKLRSILIAISLIPLLYYTYNGVIGKSPDFINIAIFFIAAAIAYLYEYFAFKRGVGTPRPTLSIVAICTLSLLFVIFTFNTPHLELFRDPLTGKYGI